jgi:hypothetical protein
LRHTDVSGTINTNTTWNLAGSLYVMTGIVTVATGKTLTIDPGVVVRVNKPLFGTYSLIVWYVARRGDADNLIVFTTTEEDPVPGRWCRIWFTDTSVDNSAHQTRSD